MTNILSDNYLPEMITYARQARSSYLWMDTSSIDQILKTVLDGFSPLCSDLARTAAEETRMGIYEDKYIYLNHTICDIRHQYLPFISRHTVHLSRMDNHFQKQPAGIIVGITDHLHPAEEVLFNCITAIRTGNPIILSFHPSAYNCSYAAAAAIRDLAVSAGAPDNSIQWLEENTPDILETLLRHPDIAAMTASGCPFSVRQYLSLCRKPCAISYPSVSFCYVHHSADIRKAVRQLILSRTFDNGLSICSEQVVCIDQPIYSAFKNVLQNERCYLASPDEITRLTAVLIDLSSDMVNPAVIGRTPQTIAALADINIPEDTRLIAMEMVPDRSDHPLLIPFLCPALLLMPVEQNEHAIEKIRKLSTPETDFSTDTLFPEFQELPPHHSLTIYAADQKIISDTCLALPDFNLTENAPASGQSLTGQYISRYGSRLNNEAIEEMLSRRRIIHEMPDISHTFQLPAVIHFQKGALDNLQFTNGQTEIALLYDDSGILHTDISSIIHRIKLKYPYLKYHDLHISENSPVGKSTDYLLPQLAEISPDCLIAIGNSRTMNLAKMLLTEYGISASSHATRLILIPSLEGCHTALLPSYGYYSQTDDTFYEKPSCTENLTIIADSSLYASSDQDKTAAACLSAMADAFDTYFSNQGNDLTDAMALQAISLVLTWLSGSSHEKARSASYAEHLQNACLLSGMAAAHTGSGLSKIMARRLYCDFRISLPTLQAILLPHIIRYNGDPHPAKKSWNRSSSGYSISHKLLYLYHTIIQPSVGILSDTSEYASAPLPPVSDIADRMAEKIQDILRASDMPLNIKACGIREKEYMLHIDSMAQKTFEQLSTTCADANPRYPLIKELAQIYKQIYE